MIRPVQFGRPWALQRRLFAVAAKNTTFRSARRFFRPKGLGSSHLPTLPHADTLSCSVRSDTHLRYGASPRRFFHAEGLVLAPVVFGGLFIALWTWKCFMMVIFQNKIIYMPGLPPNARWEKIQDYSKRCAGVDWREERIRAADGTDLALCVTELRVDQSRPTASENNENSKTFYIIYFQGNASSIPPRLPDLSSALCMMQRSLQRQTDRHSHESTRCIVACLSYRGYWTSRGRPTEKGIRLDAAAALDWVSLQHEKHTRPSASSPASSSGNPAPDPASVVLWGQSIGAGVATNLAVDRFRRGSHNNNIRLDSLILETPFTSIRAMLEVLYPQKWLPYRYLWPFLRNHLDSLMNLKTLASYYHQPCPSDNGSTSSHPFRAHPPRQPPSILILSAAKDELVPATLTDRIHDQCIDIGLPVERANVSGAFHNDTMFRAEGRRAVSEFLTRRFVATGAKR